LLYGYVKWIRGDGYGGGDMVVWISWGVDMAGVDRRVADM